jgi:hypothetical protein
MFPWPGEPCYVWLRASHNSPDIRAKENIRYELTQPQNTLTPTGLLMEGKCAHRSTRMDLYLQRGAVYRRR